MISIRLSVVALTMVISMAGVPLLAQDLPEGVGLQFPAAFSGDRSKSSGLTSWRHALAPASSPLDQESGGEGDRAPSSSGEEGWEFTLAPYFWLPTAAGDATIRGVTFGVGLDASDILEDLDFAVLAHAEARKGRLALFHDITFMELSGDERLGPARIEDRLRYGQYDFAVAYEVWERPLEEEHERLSFDLFAGVRAQHLKAVANFKPGPRISQSESFAELLVGTRGTLQLSQKARARARLDLSGFDIGSGSTLTWNLSFFLDYRLTPNTSLGLGYRGMGIDYSRGSGPNKLAVNAQFNGPVLGVTINF